MNEEKRFVTQVFKTDTEKRLVYGEVLVPNEVDAQGDIISPEVIEDAAHNFLASYRNLDYKHLYLANDQANIVESYISPVDFSVNDHIIKKGSWIMVTKIIDDQLWDEIKNGELNGYSIVGIAQSIPVE